MRDRRHWQLRPSRRGVLAMTGLTLAASIRDLCGGQDAARRHFPLPTATADSVLLLWLPGGVTHHESFDPKPLAPVEIRGPTQAISTSVPGVQFAEYIPQLARHMHQLAVVRTYSPGTVDHFEGQAFALAGRNALPGGMLSEPNVGCVVDHLLGDRGGLPGYLAVPGSTRPGPPKTDMFVPAWLGPKHAPFCAMGEPRDHDFKVHGISYPEGSSARRLQARLALSRAIQSQFDEMPDDRALREIEQVYGQAVEMITSSRVRTAFDLTAEPEHVRRKYGPTKLGQRCLLARRLIEADARFVMVDYGYDWDIAPNENFWDNHCFDFQMQPPIWKACREPHHLPAADQAFSALLEDLEQSGRLERTLVVYLTEFGRHPNINPEGGRHHWRHAGSIFFAGGGVGGGRVIGQTDSTGGYPLSESYAPADVAATIYQALGLDPHVTLSTRDGRVVPLQTEGRPIPVS